MQYESNGSKWQLWHAICSVWESPPAGRTSQSWIRRQWSRVDITGCPRRGRQTCFWTEWSRQVCCCSRILSAAGVGIQWCTVGKRTAGGSSSALAVRSRPRMLWCSMCRSWDAWCVVVAWPVKWRPHSGQTNTLHIHAWQPITVLRAAWCISAKPRISFPIIQRHHRRLRSRWIPFSIVWRLFDDNCNKQCSAELM